MTSIEKQSFNISIYMAVIVCLFFIVIGWEGSMYCNRIIEGQQMSTAMIMAKMDTVIRRQEIINNNQATINAGTADFRRRVENRFGWR